ncbi:hypothetical protein [Frigoribacterium sp. PhB24]|nr:hypothetical protein [Frigoribacterium sp. PhB24]ROS54079.1 hypothetical protein EDF50_0153 [Frigoribacterium sp. PhB24]
MASRDPFAPAVIVAPLDAVDVRPRRRGWTVVWSRRTVHFGAVSPTR